MGILQRLLRRVLGPARPPEPPVPSMPPVVPPAPIPPVTPPTPPPVISPSDLIGAINAARMRHRLAPLAPDPALIHAAKRIAADNQDRGRLDHVGGDGSDFMRRARDAGYHGAAREVLAWNYPDATSVVGGWLKSPGHRGIILHPHGVAVGAAASGPYSAALVGLAAGHYAPTAAGDDGAGHLGHSDHAGHADGLPREIGTGPGGRPWAIA